MSISIGRTSPFHSRPLVLPSSAAIKSQIPQTWNVTVSPFFRFEDVFCRVTNGEFRNFFLKRHHVIIFAACFLVKTAIFLSCYFLSKMATPHHFPNFPQTFHTFHTFFQNVMIFHTCFPLISSCFFADFHHFFSTSFTIFSMDWFKGNKWANALVPPTPIWEGHGYPMLCDVILHVSIFVMFVHDFHR